MPAKNTSLCSIEKIQFLFLQFWIQHHTFTGTLFVLCAEHIKKLRRYLVKSNSRILCYPHPSKSESILYSQKEQSFHVISVMWHKPRGNNMTSWKATQKRELTAIYFTCSFLSMCPVRLRYHSLNETYQHSRARPYQDRSCISKTQFHIHRHISYPKLLLYLTSLIKLTFTKNFIGK